MPPVFPPTGALIEVEFHVFTHSREAYSKVTEASIAKQVAKLNQVYRPVGVCFRKLSPVQWNINPRWKDLDLDRAADIHKLVAKQPGRKLYAIICDVQNAIGFQWGGLPGTVFIDFESLPDGPKGVRFDGVTLAHEMGHMFGLGESEVTSNVMGSTYSDQEVKGFAPDQVATMKRNLMEHYTELVVASRWPGRNISVAEGREACSKTPEFLSTKPGASSKTPTADVIARLDSSGRQFWVVEQVKPGGGPVTIKNIGREVEGSACFLTAAGNTVTLAERRAGPAAESQQWELAPAGKPETFFIISSLANNKDQPARFLGVPRKCPEVTAALFAQADPNAALKWRVSSV